MRSYAKVNLTLDVLGLRPDGFHDIESVIQSVGLHDTVTVSVRGEPGIRVTCDMPGIPTDERNLAHKAAVLFFEDIGAAPRVDIHIEKRIPPEAGLGGGSSNAAAVLQGLAQLLQSGGGSEFKVQGSKFKVQGSSRPATLNLEPGTLNSAAAAAVGSDVPFFTVGGAALVRGRGEEVEALPEIPTQWLVILKPSFGVSTPWAYRRLDEMRAEGARGSCRADREPKTASARMTKCIRDQAWERLPGLLSNDLELPAVERHPEIGELKNALLRAGATGALMCGSGSAIFGLFPSERDAHKAAGSLDGDCIHVILTRTIGRGKMNE